MAVTSENAKLASEHARGLGAAHNVYIASGRARLARSLPLLLFARRWH